MSISKRSAFIGQLVYWVDVDTEELWNGEVVETGKYGCTIEFTKDGTLDTTHIEYSKL